MSQNELTALHTSGTGTIVAIRGGVVSVRFPDPVPPIRELLYAGRIALEVASIEDKGVVRCIALAPVKGLGLGMPVRATGSSIMVPVGDAILGRMLNVFGAPVDNKPPPAATEHRAIHQLPPLLEDRVVRSQVLETGIKAIDLLSPIERGGKTGLFGGAGVGKTVLITELINNTVQNTRVSAYSAASANGTGRPKSSTGKWVRPVCLITPSCCSDRSMRFQVSGS